MTTSEYIRNIWTNKPYRAVAILSIVSAAIFALGFGLGVIGWPIALYGGLFMIGLGAAIAVVRRQLPDLLLWAASKNYARFCNIILQSVSKEKRIEFLLQKNEANNTALYVASQKSHLNVVEILLKNMIDLDLSAQFNIITIKNRDENSALLIAAGDSKDTDSKRTINPEVANAIWSHIMSLDSQLFESQVIKILENINLSTILRYGHPNLTLNIIKCINKCYSSHEKCGFYKMQDAWGFNVLIRAARDGQVDIVNAILDDMPIKDQVNLLLVKENQNHTVMSLMKLPQYTKETDPALIQAISDKLEKIMSTWSEREFDVVLKTSETPTQTRTFHCKGTETLSELRKRITDTYPSFSGELAWKEQQLEKKDDACTLQAFSEKVGERQALNRYTLSEVRRNRR